MALIGTALLLLAVGCPVDRQPKEQESGDTGRADTGEGVDNDTGRDSVADSSADTASDTGDSAGTIDSADSGDDGDPGDSAADTASGSLVNCDWSSAIVTHEFGTHATACQSLEEALEAGTWTLTAPRSISSAGDAKDLASVYDFEPPITGGLHWSWDSSHYGCPVVSYDATTGWWRWEGGCSTPTGRTYSGTVWNLDMADGWGGECQDFEAFELNDGTTKYLIDGRYQTWMSGDRGGDAFDLWSCVEGAGTDADAERFAVGHHWVDNGTGEDQSAYFREIQGTEPLGDYTVDVDATWCMSGDYMSNGTETIVGTSAISLTWGAVCFECAEVTIDGVAAVPYCP